MGKANFQLVLQTVNLVLGFMIWVIISSLISFIQTDIKLTPGQLSTVTAIPVILGSILRVPIGFWTNRYGARWLFTIGLLFLILPVYYISLADSFTDLIIGGLALGVGGALFSIGVTSLPKYYPKERHGFVNGIYGAGNIGTAFTSFSAPLLANAIGWRSTVQLFLILIVIFAVLTFIFGDKKEQTVRVSLTGQIKSIYKNYRLWFLCLFYFITFGSFVAFTVYLPAFLVNHFHLTKVDAGFRTAGFIVIATIMRPIGGFLADKFNPYLILIVIFNAITFSGFLLSFTPSLPIYTVGCILVAFCAGIGNGTIFKLVPLYFSKQAGIVNGIVAAMGGLGGFFPPIVLTILFNMTGHYAIGFMALSEFALAAAIIVTALYFLDKLQISNQVIESTAEGIMVTDLKGVIQRINPAFTAVTGYSKDEAIGNTPVILRSGKHDEAFYTKMWEDIRKNGSWQGEIWNKKKDGQIYLELLTISTIKDENDNPLNYVGMFNELR
ncbi:MFS transporter [Neobacillus citreus]|uniref:MFS transporter n=1 Tax=Neobacillus citreus TaxID=2833578 RepID=A0A942T8E1_9BACI|nr:nitrate/nitrite transporter [Neobacillus citreus]MCH6269560.1 MFS transporter [Neobacillus citreus]